MVQNASTASNACVAVFDRTLGDTDAPVVKSHSSMNSPAIYGLTTDTDPNYSICGEAQGDGDVKALYGFANSANSIAGYFENISTSTANALEVYGKNSGYALKAQNTRSQGAGPVALFETTQSSNTGAVVQIESDGSGKAIDINLNHTGDGIDIHDSYGRALLIKASVAGIPISQYHDARLMDLHLDDNDGDIYSAAKIRHDGHGTDPNHTLEIHGGNNEQLGAALYVKYEGLMGFHVEHFETNYDGGIGGEIDIKTAHGAGMNVVLDSTSNDSAGIRIKHDGTGPGLVSYLTNSYSSSYAIQAISSGSTSKALYADGEIECTKQIVSKGIKCHYEYNSGSGNPPANNLTVGTIFSCYDTNGKEWRLAIKSEDGKAVYLKTDGTMNIDNP